MRAFTLYRRRDVSGVSGAGRVLDGVIFASGKVVVCWLTKHTSVCVYDSYEEFECLHVRAHPENESEVVWLAEVE